MNFDKYYDFRSFYRGAYRIQDQVSFGPITILVGGTNGKGTVSFALESILRSLDLSVGLYTSPHLLCPSERIRINGRPIDPKFLWDSLENFTPTQTSKPFSFFEVMTMIALKAFQNCSFQIIEVGMGGKWDTTNVVNPTISIMTSVGWDHMEYLGSTLEAIAEDKSHIGRRNIPLLLGNIPEEAKQGIIKSAKKIGFIPFWEEDSLACIFKAVSLLSQSNLIPEVSKDFIAQKIESLNLPGRFQKIIYNHKVFILDVAHNSSAAEYITQKYLSQFKSQKCTLIFGSFAEKNWKKQLDIYDSITSSVIAVPLESSPRPSVSPEEIIEYVKGKKMACSSLEAALEHSGPLNLITGSFRHVSKALSLLSCLWILFFYPLFADKSIYYDADNIKVTKESIDATGHAFFLLDDLFFYGSAIHFDRQKEVLHAIGEIRFIRNDQTCLGSEITYDKKLKRALIKNVTYIKDPSLISSHSDLASLQSETGNLFFELERRTQVIRLKNELIELQKVWREQQKGLDKYAHILEHIYKLESLALPKVPKDLQTSRLDHLKQNHPSDSFFQFKDVPGYFSLTADKLFEDPDGIFELENVVLTSCSSKCSYLRPLFSFQSQFATIIPQNYAHLYGTSVRALDVPFFYTPFLIFPIKTERQWGLLIPKVIFGNQVSLTQFPLYLTLGDHSDITVSLDYFDKGNIGFEENLRLQLYENSEFTFEREDFSKRWNQTIGLHLPIKNKGAFKTNHESSSDSLFFVDFAKTRFLKTSLFGPNLQGERFLDQSVGLELYGEDFGSSLEFRSKKDLLETNPHLTEQIFPRALFSLYPRKYFGLPIMFEGTSIWENLEPTLGKRWENNWGGRYTLFTLPWVIVSSSIYFRSLNYYPQHFSHHLEYQASISLPLFARLDNSKQYIYQELTPTFTYFSLPKVLQDVNFPKLYDLPYRKDSAFPTERVDIQLTYRPYYVKNNPLIIKKPMDSNVYDTKFAPKSLVNFESFTLWAERELNSYKEASDQITSVGSPDPWVFSPLTFNLGTSYYLSYKLTEKAINEKLRPWDIPKVLLPWGDVIASTQWTLQPILPIEGSFSGIWNRVWENWSVIEQTASFQKENGRINLRWVDELRLLGPDIFGLDRKFEWGMEYTPLSWLNLKFQKKVFVSASSTIPQGGDKDYESLYVITFLRLQQCLDVTFQRYKPFGVLEAQATYSIGIYGTFLGQTYGVGQVAEGLNQAIYQHFNPPINPVSSPAPIQ